jgi:hypothetical protein
MSIILLLSFLSFIPHGKSHPVFLKYFGIIKDAKQTELFLVSETPVAPNEQTAGKLYLSDYEVIKKIELNDSIFNQYKNELFGAKFFSEEKKMCPMQAKYLLRFVKKKKFIHLVFSAENCKKAVIFSSAKKINGKCVELTEDNFFHNSMKDKVLP